MSEYWQYHDRENGRGKRLLLPSKDELIQFGMLIINRLNKNHINGEWFTQELHLLSSSEFFDMTSRCRKSLKILKNENNIIDYNDEAVITSAVNQLHTTFNIYFSDDGWRMTSKAIAQAKKRNKTMRTEIKSSTHALLLQLKEETKQDSIDQTIEFLIESYRESLDE